MIVLNVRRGEPIDKALKRLKRIMDRDAIIPEIRERQYYMKPSEKKRLKSARARARIRKEARELERAKNFAHFGN